MDFKSQTELQICVSINGYLFDNYASFTNEISEQLLSNYSRYAANLNMKAAASLFSLALNNDLKYLNTNRSCAHHLNFQ